MTGAILGVHAKLLGLLPIVKGLLIAGLLFALDVPFLKSLAIAAVSAIFSGAFLVIATVITVREARDNRERIEAVRQEQRDVKRALGVDNRETDQKR